MPVHLSARPTGTERITTPFRADVEGLRAIAVIAVLLFHGQLGPFGGGYFGVDIFFVVSGFLITGILLRGLGERSTALPAFWARRMRRIVPASTLVILTTVLVGRLVLDPLTQQSLARDAAAAGLFVVNIVFALRESDYFASQATPSPLHHFWSLAVEEQFYIVWPLLLFAVTRVRTHQRTVLAILVGGLWIASFAACVIVTAHDQPRAFYLLPTRAWELLSGAALAIVAPQAIAAIRPVVRAALGWIGVAAVGAAIVLLGGRQDVPGAIALWPVAGTAAILLAGVVPTRRSPASSLSTRPLVWIGRRSYGIYLWHWPALVLTAAWAGPLSSAERGALLVASVALAALTARVFENPVRHSAWMAKRPRRGLVLGAALVALVVTTASVSEATTGPLDAGSLARRAVVVVPEVSATAPNDAAVPADSAAHADVTSTTDSAITPTTTLVAPTTSAPAGKVVIDLGAVVAPIIAANATALAAAVATQDVPANLRPTLSRASADKSSIYDDGCILSDGQHDPPPCVFGDASSSVVIALFGDSHAAQWFPALEQIASEHGWRLIVDTKKGCPTADIRIRKTGLDAECGRWRALVAECGRWRALVADQLALEQPALLIMSSYRYRAGGSGIGLDPDEAWRSGLTATMSALRPTSGQVLLLGDTPTPAVEVPSCVAGHLRSVAQCVAPRQRAITLGRLAVEHEVADRFDALTATTGDWLCTDTSCPVIIGDTLLYRDGNHLTTTGSLLLAPYLDATLSAVIGNP